jgi:cobaltochelatase CobN
LPRLDTYLCDLKESQIRDGLHVFGESPTGRLRIDTLLALLRIPVAMGVARNQACSGAGQGLRAGLRPARLCTGRAVERAASACVVAISDEPWRTAGDTRERLFATQLIAQALDAL